MSMSDPIADMLTRIRNASGAKLADVRMPSSVMRAALAETLQEAGYIESYRVEDLGNNKKQLHIVLKYKGKDRTPVIEGIDRVSKPSRRVYVGCADIPRVLGGLGIAILSTSSGLFTDREARKRNIGGEVLCYVW
ncbi:MAG: 30S ribosomal protein S8 [Oligosphaeraceae bacterium]|jgi:small subunit ribosomal protein S8|nr:30S ribosomal protein S8 [Oligosphaeraceae bacterium]